MLESIDLFRLTGTRINYLAQRQNVVARNIANADTPGYQAQDIPPFTPQSPLLAHTQGAGAAASLALARTSGAHLESPNATTGEGQARVVNAQAYAEKPDGNKVSLEEQMMKSADTANAFALASAAYAKSIAILKIGIDSGR